MGGPGLPNGLGGPRVFMGVHTLPPMKMPPRGPISPGRLKVTFLLVWSTAVAPPEGGKRFTFRPPRAP